MPSKRTISRSPKFPLKSHPNPSPPQNPNPKPNKMMSQSLADDPATTTTITAADASSSRKSQRKRKARFFPDAAFPPPKLHHHRSKIQSLPDDDLPLSPSAANQRRWTDDDALNLLRALITFRSRTGATPTAATLPSFHDSIKRSLPPQITQDQLYNKIRHLRQKFNLAAAHGPRHTPFFKLASEVWLPADPKNNNYNDHPDTTAEDDANREESGAHESLLMLNLVEYCRKNGLPAEELERGMKLVAPAKVRALESGLRLEFGTELKLHAKRCDLEKDILVLLRGISRSVS